MQLAAGTEIVCGRAPYCTLSRHAHLPWPNCRTRRVLRVRAAAHLPGQRKRGRLEPRLGLTQLDTLLLQLEVLKDNNTPYIDHGVEVLYRFTSFDPFKRSTYFGAPTDLGQFERFRRMFHAPEFATLLCHTSHELLSALQVSELQWKQRLAVQGYRKGDERTYTVTLVQRRGGHYDGVWFTESLLCDANSVT